MTPQEEIERILKDYAPHWHILEHLPAIQQAITDVNPTRLSELAAIAIYGNWWGGNQHGLEDCPPRRVVTINKGDTGWWDMIYVKFKEGNHVNLENFVYPDDFNKCKALADIINAQHSMNPVKTIFFFRHPQ